MPVKDRKLRMLLPLFYYTKTLDLFKTFFFFSGTPGWEMDSSEASHWQDSQDFTTGKEECNLTETKLWGRRAWRPHTESTHSNTAPEWGRLGKDHSQRKYTTRAEQTKHSALQGKIGTLQVNICWRNASIRDLFLSPNDFKKKSWLLNKQEV